MVLHHVPVLLFRPTYQMMALLVVVVVFLWIDARPAFALAVYFGLWFADRLLAFFTITQPTPLGQRGPSNTEIFLGPLTWGSMSAAVVLGALGLWLVRRQEVL